MIPEAKKCKGCGVDKPAADYYRTKSKGVETLRPRCKPCHIEQTLVWYERNRQKMIEYAREHYRANHDAKLKKNAEWRRANRDATEASRRKWRAEDPRRNRAHQRVLYEIRMGRMERLPCEVCGADVDIQAHHDDYAKPLDVRWLCRSHHRQHHENANPRSRRMAS